MSRALDVRPTPNLSLIRKVWRAEAVAKLDAGDVLGFLLLAEDGNRTPLTIVGQ
jgi:hypothetical protein